LKKAVHNFIFAGGVMEPYFGNLIVIGGAEDKENECEILKEVVRRTKERGGPLIVLTAATEYPEEVGATYKNTFKRLHFKDIKVVHIRSRDEANTDDYGEEIEGAGCIFFTGGDQLKITSMIGGTSLYESLKIAYRNGTIIVGTSAGASCVCSTMVVSGVDDESPSKCTIKMAPGLDLVRGVLIDQHFAQRGRTGRLLAAVAQNPEMLGIGIDENTAIVFEGSSEFSVIGSGAVTVVDGSHISHTNPSELAPDEILAITDIKMHILPKGYKYNVISRIPVLMNKNEEEKDKNETN
jgi:cyanophycinase